MCTSLALASKAQQNTEKPQYIEYVFEVPQLDLIKQLPDFKTRLRTIPNVNFMGFCESRKLLLIQAPASQLPQINDLFGALNFVSYQKENASFRVAEAACGSKKEIEISKMSN
jgi:hypothetical protein